MEKNKKKPPNLPANLYVKQGKDKQTQLNLFKGPVAAYQFNHFVRIYQNCVVFENVKIQKFISKCNNFNSKKENNKLFYFSNFFLKFFRWQRFLCDSEWNKLDQFDLARWR